MNDILKKSLVFGTVLIMTAIIFSGIQTNAKADLYVYEFYLSVYYPFDDHEFNTGIPYYYDVKDESENLGHGKKFGNARYVDSSKFGRAMMLDGDGDYVKSFTTSYSVNDFTVQMWIFPDESGGSSFYTLIDDGIYDNYKHRILINKNPGDANYGKLLAQFAGINFYSYKSVNWYEWNHIAYIYKQNGNNQYFYLNGELVGKRSGHSEHCKLNGNFQIGKSMNTPDYYFKGIIDEVIINNWPMFPKFNLAEEVPSLHLSFEEKSTGSAIFDNTYDRSVFNHVGYITGGTVNWNSNGVFNSHSLYFNGGHVEIPPHPMLELSDGAFTIEAWIKAKTKPGGGTQYHTIADRYNGVGGYTFYLEDGKLKLSIYNSPTSIGHIVGTTDLRDDKWHHVACTYGNEEMGLYVDGVEEATPVHQRDPPATDNEDDLWIGARSYPSPTWKFYGNLDDVRIYNCLKNVGREVLRMPFDEGTGSQTNDDSSYSHEGDIFGAAWCPGKYDTALDYSNGQTDHVMIPASSSLNINSHITIEAWIYWGGWTLGSPLQTIVHNEGDYWLFIDSFDGKLYFEPGSFTSPIPPQRASSTSTIPTNKWTHVAVSRFWEGTPQRSVRIYINGVLDSWGSTYGPDPSGNNPTYIGAHGIYRSGISALSHGFNGIIDGLVISNYEKTFREDIDGDSMSDMYEIIRSVDSDQYNSIEHNGRHALLMCWEDYDLSNPINLLYAFWNDVEFTYQTLKAHGYYDRDIFVLNENDPPTKPNAPDIVDTTLSIVNVQNTLDEIDDASKGSDFVFIFGTDHGNHNTNDYSGAYMEEFEKSPVVNYWDTNFATDVNRIGSYGTMFIQLSFCYSGGFIDDLSKNDRIIISAAAYYNKNFIRPDEVSANVGLVMGSLYGHGPHYSNPNLAGGGLGEGMYNEYMDADTLSYGEDDCLVSISEAFNYAIDHEYYWDVIERDYLMYDDNGEPIDQNDQIDYSALADDKHYDGNYYGTLGTDYWEEAYDTGTRYYWDDEFDTKYGSSVLNGDHIDGPGMHIPTKDPNTGTYLKDYTFSTGSDYCGYDDKMIPNGWNEGILGGKTYL